MTDLLLHWLWQATWQSALLVLLILLLQLGLGRLLSPSAKLALWLLVPLRLLLPVLPESPFSIWGLLHQHAEFAPARAPLDRPVVLTYEVHLTSSAVPAVPSTPGLTPTPFHWPKLILWIYLAGLAIMALRLAIGIRRLRRITREAKPLPQELLHPYSQQIGLRSSVKLAESPAISTPCLAGFRRPTLLLPANLASQLPAAQLKLILLHELTHLKHRDHLLNPVLVLLQSIHWFNPFAHLAFSRIRLLRELICDQQVLRETSAETSCLYGETLIRLATSRLPSFSPTTLAMSEGKQHLKTRILMLGSKYRRTSLLLVGALLLGVILLLLTKPLTTKPSSPPPLSSAATRPVYRDTGEAPVSTRVYDIADLIALATADPGARPEDSADSIARLLRETLEPDTQLIVRLAPGKLRLVVTGTEKKLDEVAALLAQLREGQALQISLQVHFVLLQQKNLEKAGLASLLQQRKEQKPRSVEGSFLTSKQADSLLQRLPELEGKDFASPQILMLNGTEAEIKAISSRTIVASVEPTTIPTGHLYAPTTESIDDGLKLHVRANVSADRKYVTLYLRPRLSKTLEIQPFSYRNEQDELSIQEPRTQQIDVETLVSVPDDQTIVLGGQVIGDRDDPNAQMFLVLAHARILNSEKAQ